MNKVWTIVLIAGSTVVATGAWAHGGKDGGPGHRGAHFERLDTNRDGKVTKVEAQATGDQLFTEMDADKDGVVTASEAQAGMEAKRQQRLDERFAAKDANKDGRLSKEEADMAERRFLRLDSNKDQVLTKEEMLQAFQGKADKQGKGGEGFFKRLDENQDGKVTRAEVQTVGERLFARLDKNSDGQVTQDEMTQGRKGRGEGRHGAKAPKR